MSFIDAIKGFASASGVKRDVKIAKEEEEIGIFSNSNSKGQKITENVTGDAFDYISKVTAEDVLGEDWNAVNTSCWDAISLAYNTDGEKFNVSEDGTHLYKTNEDGSMTYKKILYDETSGQYARVITTRKADGTVERSFEIENEDQGTKETSLKNKEKAKEIQKVSVEQEEAKPEETKDGGVSLSLLNLIAQKYPDAKYSQHSKIINKLQDANPGVNLNAIKESDNIKFPEIDFSKI